MGTQWIKCAPIASELRPEWFSHRESTAGADAENCLGLIWVPTAEPEASCFLLVGTPQISRGVWPGSSCACKCFCVAAVATQQKGIAVKNKCEAGLEVWSRQRKERGRAVERKT